MFKEVLSTIFNKKIFQIKIEIEVDASNSANCKVYTRMKMSTVSPPEANNKIMSGAFY